MRISHNLNLEIYNEMYLHFVKLCSFVDNIQVKTHK